MTFTKLVLSFMRASLKERIRKSLNKQSYIKQDFQQCYDTLKCSCVEQRFYYGETVKTNTFDNMKPLKDASFFPFSSFSQ